MTLPLLLLVDDDLEVLSSMSRYLRLEGFDVHLAENMTRAIQRLNHSPFGCVITDYAMEGGTGIELCLYIRANHPTVPVVLMSGMATTETVVDAMKSGAETFVEKPIDPEALVVLLTELVRAGPKADPLRLTDGLEDKTLLSRVRDFEKYLIEKALLENDGSVKLAMESLGLNRRTMNEKMARLGIDRATLKPHKPIAPE